jgi:nitroreductase
MELNDVMRTTFAAREFTGDDLPDDVLHDIIENARFAPSGGNRQGNRVIVIRDPDTRAEIGKLATPPAKRYIAQLSARENPYNTIEPTRVTAAEIENTPPPVRLIEPLTKASVVLVFVIDLKVVASTDQFLDRIGMISGASIYPFVWNVLLGARQAGFGGVLTTLPIAAEPGLKALLDIPEHFAVAALVPLGKPVKQLTKLKRRAVEEIAVRERFDGAAFSVG